MPTGALLQPSTVSPDAPGRMHGLSSQEAQHRLLVGGPNSLPQPPRRSIARIVTEVLREPMIALLTGAAIVYLVLGDGAEAVVLAAFATASTVLTVVQEARTERVLDALRDLSAPSALVIRDGRATRLHAAEVVPGDLLILEAGDRVAADGTLVEAADLQIDESLLTGEALPVAKRAGPMAQGASSDPEAVRSVRAFGGTLVTHGTAIVEVTATGELSEIGRIGRSLADIDQDEPRLRRETSKLVRLCAIGGVAISLLVAVLYMAARGNWLEAMLAGISIAMSMLPEEFPVVLTVFLAMGAWRIGQAGVLTRKASAIETLGSATILCTDKTGTLTENRMTITELWHPALGRVPVRPGEPRPDELGRLLETAALASPIMPSDPMEIAIHTAFGEVPASRGRKLVRTYGLSADLPAMSNIWERDDAELLDVAAKGAPEAIATMCKLDADERTELLRVVADLAAHGTRVLGVARATAEHLGEHGSQRDHAFALVGLIGLSDPLRSQIPEAIAQLRSAGVRIVMITGDHAATAFAIARQAGLEAGQVLTGAELASLSDAELIDRLADTAIFARILPDQKLRLVRAFRASGEVVAMIGDGVNDAPSLKAADIGIAMGQRGTDVAREAASIVLLDDDFGSVVTAVRLGRRIYDNLRKAMAFIFAVHVPLAGLALLPFFLGAPILLGPIHIALVEMIIDPVCALVFEAEREERDVMQRLPRPANERLFPTRLVVASVGQGAVALCMAAALFIGAMNMGLEIPRVRALTFFALVSMIAALILANRSFSASFTEAIQRHNRALQLILGAVLISSGIILLVPALREILGLGILSTLEIILVIATGIGLLAILEVAKRFSSRWLSLPVAGSRL